jgi:predicted NodU family carbamoyl transferase
MNYPACIQQYRQYKTSKEQEKVAKEGKAEGLAAYKRGQDVNKRFYDLLPEEHQVTESKLLKKGKKRRIHELMTKWVEEGPKRCPRILESSSKRHKMHQYLLPSPLQYYIIHTSHIKIYK